MSLKNKVLPMECPGCYHAMVLCGAKSLRSSVYKFYFECLECGAVSSSIYNKAEYSVAAWNSFINTLFEEGECQWKC